MRPGQQKQRGRGRSGGGGNPNNNNNNQRKGQNPLTRTYDSSGPDVKIRGTAQHIAEKYMALARDATSSGDRVMAENYLQHAEHYNRIIAAAQAMFQERFQRDDRVDNADRDEDEIEAVQQPQHHQQQPEVESEAPQPVVAQSAQPAIDENTPQPVFEETPAEVQIEQESASGETQERTPRRRNNAGRPRRQPRQPREGKAETEAPAPVEEPAE
jgi:hypothetical protein